MINQNYSKKNKINLSIFLDIFASTQWTGKVKLLSLINYAPGRVDCIGIEVTLVFRFGPNWTFVLVLGSGPFWTIDLYLSFQSNTFL